MERSDYRECDACQWLVYDSEGGGDQCPHCKGVLRRITELKGKALDGDQPYRFDETLAMALAETAGGRVRILISEE